MDFLVSAHRSDIFYTGLRFPLGYSFVIIFRFIVFFWYPAEGVLQLSRPRMTDGDLNRHGDHRYRGLVTADS